MTEIIIGALAVWEVIEIWRHSHLFATWRARVDLWEGRLGQLLHCPFCMAPWVSLLVVSALETSKYLAQHSSRSLAIVAIVLNVIVYTLAVARLANLYNDVAHRYCRTPKSDQLDLDDDNEEPEDEDPPQSD